MAATMRLGFSISPKKRQKFMLPFIEWAAKHNVECVELDMSGALPPTVEVDVLLHKLVDELATNDEKSLGNLRAYIAGHPNTVVVEPLDSIISLMERHTLLEHLAAKDVPMPGFAVWREENNVPVVETHGSIKFPIICKSLLSCGQQFTHNMAVVANQADLVAVAKLLPLPLLLQNYIEHDDVVWKVYVVADNVWTYGRISTNRHAHNTVFDSQSLIHSAEGEAVANPPSKEAVGDIVKKVREALGLDLLGVDLVIDKATGAPLVVDVNYFPGYKEVKDVNSIIMEYLISRHRARLAA